MSKLKEYFNERTSEQIFSLCLLVGVVVIMLFCCIVRLCGGLWFTADLSAIKEPSIVWQEVIMGILLAFELTFVYKLLCRAKWWICVLIAIMQSALNAAIGYAIPDIDISHTVVNVFNLISMFVIPLPFIKQRFSLIDSAIVYIAGLLYGLLFMVGRIGGINNGTYNFVANILGIIDYKLFIISLYLAVNYFGGIKLWKTQKRLILQKRLTTK